MNPRNPFESTQTRPPTPEIVFISKKELAALKNRNYELQKKLAVLEAGNGNKELQDDLDERKLKIYVTILKERLYDKAEKIKMLKNELEVTCEALKKMEGDMEKVGSV
jgi:predicted RNase H-like nuclease (RuvC/YqgF family)